MMDQGGVEKATSGYSRDDGDSPHCFVAKTWPLL